MKTKWIVFLTLGSIMLTACGTENSIETSEFTTTEVSSSAVQTTAFESETETQTETLAETASVLLKEGENDMFRYEVYDNYIKITQYIGSESVVDIPDEIDGIPIKIIGDSSFYGLSGVQQVNIPAGVEKIEEWAFNACVDLEIINIPYGISEIADCTFGSCFKLKAIEIPDSVKEIGDNAFRFCQSLTEITVPGGVLKIGDLAFESCTELEEINISKTVKEIGIGAFDVTPWYENQEKPIIINDIEIE